MTIKVLDKAIVSQIAAGEVVERPASVVKELVENSLDAGSSQISVEVKGGGVNLIRITDNGSGISSGEVALAFQRHATSKIGNLEDLQSIRSLGFRGEALPSIAAVSDIEIDTCAGGESAGTHLSLKDDATISRQNQGRPRGTTIIARNLFRRIPARLKFLKSLSTENSHIANVVSQYALCFPEVRFTLLIDGKSTLRTSGKGKLIDTVIDIYGTEIARNMLKVENDGEWKREMATPLEVTGMVSSPAVSRSGRGYLSFFVNRRWVNSRLLAWAVEEAYHGLLMVRKHPIAVINISIPPEELDVNIHPAKSEVKFQNERMVFSAVQKMVRRALVEQMPVPRIEEVAAAYASPAQKMPELWTAAGSSGRLITPTPQTLPSLNASLPVLRVVGQALAGYIVAEGPDGLYLIDQHAAHERVLFEKVRQQGSAQELEVQGLLEPATLEVNPQQEEILKSCYQDLAKFGFTIEPFGDRTYLVRTVPRLLHNGDWAAMLRELLDSLSNDGKNDWSEKAAISLACHGAVRSGKKLTDDEMRALVRQLEQTANPHTCPHGRPTMIHLSAGQLSREFGRR